eukprot:1058361-Rhodomonas_salina.3
MVPPAYARATACPVLTCRMALDDDIVENEPIMPKSARKRYPPTSSLRHVRYWHSHSIRISSYALATPCP